MLAKRDSTSYDLIKISSQQIHQKLKRIQEFTSAKSIGSYYPIGSEVLTQNIMQDAISQGKEIYLPKVVDNDLIFKKIEDLSNLEKGDFDIMEPKDGCPVSEKLDVILVPTVAVSSNGFRLGYGYGYYDRFLAQKNLVKIALTYAKQVVKSIPHSDTDIKIDWIVTEDEFFNTSKIS